MGRAAEGTMHRWGMGRLLSLLLLGLLLGFGSGPARGATLHEESLELLAKMSVQADPVDWRFVFMGDNRGNDAKFKEALRLASGFKPLFILHGGDIAERGSGEELAHFRNTLASVPGLPPVFVVRGNHEMDAALFERLIGPREFTLDDKRLGFRLVAVDNADYSLGKRGVEYLERMLDNSRPVQLVAMHVPPQTERWEKHSFVRGKEELARLLAERRVKLALFAHIHLFDRDTVGGVPAVVSGGAGARLAYIGYPGVPVYHIVVVEVKKGALSYRVEEVH